MTIPAHAGRMLFVNIPVADVERSKAFFAKLGFSYNPMFTDETAACMLVGEHAFVMLLSREKFAEFSKLPIANRPRTRWRCTASASHPAMRSIRSAPLRSRRAAPRRMTPRTTASCTHAASSISTATAGRSCGWIRRRRSRAPRRSRLHAGRRRPGLTRHHVPRVRRRRAVRAAASRFGKLIRQGVTVTVVRSSGGDVRPLQLVLGLTAAT